METPVDTHLIKYPNVYSPREDTYLMLDALEADLERLHRLNPLFIGEIGCGNGVTITALAKHFPGSLCYATDLNKSACLAAAETATVNNSRVEPLCMNFMDCFRPNFFHVLIFNPPYVATESADVFGDDLQKSWAGGTHGREVMDQLFPKIPTLLSNNGLFYLLVEKQNKPHEIKQVFSQLGFQCAVIRERKIVGEHLFVLRFNSSWIKSDLL